LNEDRSGRQQLICLSRGRICGRKRQVIGLPVAHAEGNYFADADTLDALEEENRAPCNEDKTNCRDWDGLSTRSTDVHCLR
jgi:hypothetical protein